MLDMSGSMERVVPNISLAADWLVSQFKRGDRINVGTFKTDVRYGNIVTATNFANRTGVIVYAIGMSRGQTANELYTLATGTGGSYFYLDRREDFVEAFRQVGEEIHAQYILGFEPADRDKKSLINVRVKTPGLKVRARQTYSPKQK